MGERSITIPERTFGTVRIREKRATVQERVLDRSVIVTQKTATIHERVFGTVRILGHDYFTLTITSGPTATPAITSCLIEWTVNAAAYHRVWYKKNGAPTYSVTAWSGSATLSASVTLTPLDGEHTLYHYYVESDIDKTGKNVLSSPDIFYTLCNNAIVYSGYGIFIDFIGALHMRFTTNTVTIGRCRWRPNPGSYKPWSIYTGGYVTIHQQMTANPVLIPVVGKSYFVQGQAKNKCGFEQTPSNELFIYDIGGIWNYFLVP